MWLSIHRGGIRCHLQRSQGGPCHPVCSGALSFTACCAITNACSHRSFCCLCMWQLQFSLFALYFSPLILYLDTGIALGHTNGFTSALPSFGRCMSGTDVEAVGSACWPGAGGSVTELLPGVILAVTQFLWLSAAFWARRSISLRLRLHRRHG